MESDGDNSRQAVLNLLTAVQNQTVSKKTTVFTLQYRHDEATRAVSHRRRLQSTR